MVTRDGPLWLVILAVTSGASLGAMIRWAFCYALNSKDWISLSPLGTVVSNYCAAYLMGMALAWLYTRPEVSPAVRLFIVTGFLGALSTLTAVLGENLNFVMLGQWSAALVHFFLQIVGSYVVLCLGFLTLRGHIFGA